MSGAPNCANAARTRRAGQISRCQVRISRITAWNEPFVVGRREVGRRTHLSSQIRYLRPDWNNQHFAKCIDGPGSLHADRTTKQTTTEGVRICMKTELIPSQMFFFLEHSMDYCGQEMFKTSNWWNCCGTETWKTSNRGHNSVQYSAMTLITIGLLKF